MGMMEHVTFVTNSSLTYLDECDESFDLIFLDGDHSAAMVYQDYTGRCGACANQPIASS